MYLRRVSLQRRAVLRGLGAALALPLLDAMVPALTAATRTALNPVRRLGVVYVPNGMAMEYWTPAAEGDAFELTPILKPLAPFREQLLVLSGFKLPWAAPHAGGSTSFLTGQIGAAGETDIVCGVSMDQLVAKEFGRYTQLPSLELAVESKGNSGQCSQGYSCVYLNTISWRDARTPLPMESNPRIVFEQLFGDTPSTEWPARQARIRRRLSILDSVTEALADLTRNIGPTDRARLDQYLDGIRDVERRLQRMEQSRNRALPPIEQPAGSPASYREHARLMFDLQLLAYQCDVTRVITFMMGREQSSLTFPEIGVPDSHHPLSHHAYDPEKILLMSRINHHHVSLLSEYLAKLRSTPDGDGTLLDHVMLLYGAGISDSNAHRHDNLPILLAGGGSDTLDGGRHLRFGGDPPLADLLLTMMDKLGLPLDRLGDGEEKIVIDSVPALRPI